MSSLGSAAQERHAADDPVEAATVCAAFQRTVELYGERPALRTVDDSVNLTWTALADRVRRVAGGLAALGVGHGDTVALLLPNSVECHLVDFAAAHLGAVPFTIYNSSAAHQIAHQLRNADAKVLVTAEAFGARAQEAITEAPAVEHVVVVDGAAESLTLEAVEERCDPGFDLEAAWRAVDAEDLATLIFTSGTTGPPKGAQYAHRTVMAQLRAMQAAVPLPRQALVSFLPMAHTGGRLTCHYLALPYGACITVCPDMGDLPRHMTQVRPDAAFAVPRLWEKFQVALEALVDNDQSGRAAAAVARGLEIVRAHDGAEADGPASERESPAEEEERLAVLQPILHTLGLDRVEAAYVGGAPCSPDIVQFFRAVGVPLLEAYGLTEGCLNIFNRVEEFKTGSAGRPLPGVEIRLAPDGELLVRAPLNFVSYRKEPEQTAAALDADGWLHTGDIAEVDDLGFVSIVDRKKEIIINAAGKNMSPANIEQAIKGQSSLIGQVVTIGDGRRYNTALITLDPDAAPMYARRHAVSGSLEDLAGAAVIRTEIERAVAAGNERLSRVEQVKKFALLGVAWAPDSEELTPTLKLKRRVILKKYAAEIDALYA